MRYLDKSMLAAAASIIAITASSAAFAESDWSKTHPRRDQVNDRLKHIDQRVHTEVKEGDMSKQQAKALYQQDHQIRQEERDMASQNNGHISKQEQHTLNQQENALSKSVGH